MYFKFKLITISVDCKFIIIYCNQALRSDVKQYNNFSVRRWFASVTTERQSVPESDPLFVNQTYSAATYRQGRLQQTDVILSVSGKAHSKLHGSVIQVIMTQILKSTATQLSGHCRRHSAKDGTNRWVVCSTSGWAGMLSWPIACNILGGLHTRTKYKAC